jgi:ParB family transcriptional regulator, chromosome partitioning protein
VSYSFDDPKAKPSRLGRGLSSLMGEVEGAGPAVYNDPAAAASSGQANNEPGVETKSATSSGTSSGPSVIAVDQIRRNPAQPRRTFDDASLRELADSLKAKGVLQAILVRPDPKEEGKYQIIAGERRWRAARMAGLTHIPAIVRSLDELELLEFGIIENVQRADLNAIEEAEAYEALMKRFGRTQETLAATVGKSRVHIANTLRLLQLPEEARAYVREGRISAGHARAALGGPDPEALIRLAAEKGLSVRDVETRAKAARDTVSGFGPGAGPGAVRAAVKAAAEKDIDTEALESDLMRALGLEVDIRHSGTGGELRIKYRELEQLDDVCRRLTAKRQG